MLDKFSKLIKPYITLSEEELNFIKSKVPLKVHKKNDVIFREGKISRTIYFVLDGCVRLYYNVDGVEKTAFFYLEGKFICAGESFTHNKKATENYQAIEDSALMHFDKDVIEEMLQKFPRLGVIGQIATEEELISCQKMIASFVTKSPEQRYLELLASKSELFQRAPQQYIASFLGVSPETLSRIKKRITAKAKNIRS
ncbi:MAG: Crp/Fnr family transcriptional regulator [Aureispira sp.]|nr:Crp/Fnr family transcriptional regulator [Aureispira sp.]